MNEPTKFSETSIYSIITANVGSANFVSNQALEYFRNRIIRGPKINSWVEVLGEHKELVEVKCINDGKTVTLKKIAATVEAGTKRGAKINLGKSQFWFEQCECGLIYYARRIDSIE